MRRNGRFSLKDLKRGRQKDRQAGQFSVQQHLNQSNRHEGETKGRKKRQRCDSFSPWKGLLWIQQEADRPSWETDTSRPGDGRRQRCWTVTYAVAVSLHVRGVPVVGVRGWRAAPAGGCRVGRRPGNDHVEGRLRGLKSRKDDMRRWRGCQEHLEALLNPFLHHFRSLQPSESDVVFRSAQSGWPLSQL